MTGLDLICTELLEMIFAKDWRDVRINVAPVTYEIRATHFEQDTADMCVATGWNDYGFVYDWDEKVVLK